MNRRTFLNWSWLTSIFAVLGFTARHYGKASPKACALSHNGIISRTRTPWALGVKVYVNGKFIPNVVSVNTRKGYVMAYGENKHDGDLSWLNQRRIYGWIDVDDSDCHSNHWENTRTQSVTSVNPKTGKYDPVQEAA